MLNYINGLILFATMFVGNAAIFEVPLLPIWASIYIIITLIAHEKFRSADLRYYNGAVIGFIVVYFILIGDSYRPYDDNFWMWPIALLMLVLGYANHIQLKISPNKWDLFSIILLLSIMVIGGLFNLDENGRASFVFGSNVLYRVYIFLGLYIAMHPKTKRILIYFSIALSLVGVLATQSTGGLVLLSLLIIAMIVRKIKSNKLIISTFIIILSISIFYLSDEVYNFIFENTRILDLKINETNERLNALYNMPSHFTLLGENFDVFYQNFYSEGFQYPHNIILELTFYYGIFGVFCSLMIVINMFISYKKFSNSSLSYKNIYNISFFVVAVGAMFSGDIVDNIYVMVFVFANIIVGSTSKLNFKK